jgi:hypothetical protein
MKLNLLSFLLMALFSSSVYSQSITNTFGSNGSFIIKDGSTTFFSLSQNNGRTTLSNSISFAPTTAAEIGVIYKANSSFIHDYSGPGTTGLNTFIGMSAGNFTMGGTNQQGSLNSVFGASAFMLNSTGSLNSVFGVSSLQSNTTGYGNCSFGGNALAYNSTGYSNSAFGQASLGGQELGYQNSAFGESAGITVTSGSNLTIIGFNAQPTSGVATNQITLGNNQVTSLRCNVQSITSLSDARDKKNIQNLDLGIDFLMKLKPRQFNWDKREWYDNNKSDGSKIQKSPTAGFIAQELDAVQMSANADWLNLVLKDNPNRIEATTGNLLPIIVKAIQDLKKENDGLKAKNENFQAANDKLMDRLSRFEKMQTILVTEIEELRSNNNETTKVSLETK